MADPWGVGGMLLRDRNNKFYPFPHVKPHFNAGIIQQVSDRFRQDSSGDWDDEKFKKGILARFVQLVRQHDETMHHMPSGGQLLTELSFWLTLVAQVLGHRYWLLISYLRHGESIIEFRPFQAPSPKAAMDAIDSVVIDIIANTVPSHTVH